MIAHSPHPLFPVELEDQPEEGEDVHEIGHIRITRFNPLQNRFIWALENHKPDELMTLEQLYEQYGGGKFELYAHLDQAGHPGAVIRRIRYDVPGELRPLVPGELVAAPPAPAPAPSSTPAPDAAGGPMSGMDRILMMMISQQSESNKLLVAMVQNMGTMMAAAMNNRGGGDAASSALATIAAAALNRPTETSTDAVIKAVQLGRDLADGGGPPGGDAGDEEDIASSILEGVRAFHEVANAGGAAVVPGQRIPGMTPNVRTRPPPPKPANAQ